MSATTKEMIDHIKDRMRHRNPTGDLETILHASLALLLAQLEKERHGKTPRLGSRRRKPAEAMNACASSASANAEVTPRATTAPARVVATADETTAPVRSEAKTQVPRPRAHAHAGSGNQGGSAPANAGPNTAEPTESTPATKASRRGSRYVPAKLRREVFARDGERCSYVGPDGDRCPARGYLELDHIHPKAFGGQETTANLRVRCRAHNALYAEQVFGRAHIEGRIDLRRRKCAPPTPDSFETAARGLRSMGFRELDARRGLEMLATMSGMKAAPLETVIREALRVLT